MTTPFAALGLPPELARVADELGWTAPTPIQARAVPPLLEGRDVIGRAHTGTGKTAAFGMPLLAGLPLELKVPRALVLGPTRELAAQLVRDLRTFGRHLPELRVLALTGGRPVARQARSLEGGAHVIVGTPGRVLDHLRRGTLQLDAVDRLVLDEADRMLEMGFRDDVLAIVGRLPAERRAALFSATFPPAVEALAAELLTDPVFVDDDGDEAPPVRHLVHRVPDADRTRLLEALLDLHRPDAALVFADERAEVDALADGLVATGHDAAALHGGLSQLERDRVMVRLRNGSLRVVVATDLAARGLDVDGLDLVVSVGLPDGPETLLHRIGRTGRAGRQGLAVTVAAVDTVPPDDAEPADSAALLARALGRPEPAPYETLLVGGGRKDKLRPGDLLGALTGEAGLDAAEVGLIEVHDRWTYVAVVRQRAADAARRLSRGRIKRRRFRVQRLRGPADPRSAPPAAPRPTGRR